MLRTEGDVRRLVLEAAEDDVHDGGGWLEIQVDPSGYAARFGGVTAFTDLVIDAVRSASEQTGLGMAVVIAANRTRHPLDARTLARLAGQYAGRGVVGFGLSNDERRGSTADFASAFRIAERAGLRLVPHAGELRGPEHITACLDSLHAQRLGHGVRSAEDPRLLERIVASGVALEICPVKQCRAGVYSDLSSVPLPTLLEAGATIALGSDDPLLFGSRLLGQYAAMRAAHDLSDEQLAELARMSVRASSAPDDVPEATVGRYRRVAAAIIGGVSDPDETAPFTHQPYGTGPRRRRVAVRARLPQPSGPDYVTPPSAPPPTRRPGALRHALSASPTGSSPAGHRPTARRTRVRWTTRARRHRWCSASSRSCRWCWGSRCCFVTFPGVCLRAVRLGDRRQGQARHRAAAGVYGNLGTAQTGMWMGIVMTIIGFLATVGFVALVVWIGVANPVAGLEGATSSQADQDRLVDQPDAVRGLDTVADLAGQGEQLLGGGAAAVGEREGVLGREADRPAPYPLLKPACSISHAALVLILPSACGQAGAPSGRSASSVRRGW